jgi:hypothetical protein
MSGCEGRRSRGSSGLDPRECDDETLKTQRPATKPASHPPPRLNRAHTSPRPVAGEDVRPATSTCGRGGRAGSARRWSSVTLRMVLGGFLATQDKAQAARDRRGRQARAEIARAVRTGYVAPPPAGGLHRSGLRIRDPKASGRRPRGAPVTCRNGILQTSTPGAPRTLRRLPNPPGFPTGTCARACPQGCPCVGWGHAQGHVPGSISQRNSPGREAGAADVWTFVGPA